MRVWLTKLVFLTLLIAVSAWFMSAPLDSPRVGTTWFHNVNLIFHEAGHVVFMFFGRFIHILGGTLGQLLIPLICLFVFLFKEKNRFGAAAAGWWFSQSLMDVAVYINDARAGNLVLLSGFTGSEDPEGHDWFLLLNRTGLLLRDRDIAAVVYNLGRLGMIAALIWAGYILYKDALKLRGTPPMEKHYEH